MKLTLLSLSLGGSWGSFTGDLGGCAVTDGALGFSLEGGGGAFGVSSVTFGFSTLDGSGVDLVGSFSDGATCVTPSPDFEITATLLPGWTTSPSFATS